MMAPLMTLRAEEAEAESPSGGVRGDRGGGGTGGGAWWGRGSVWDNVRNPSRVVLRPGEAAAGPGEVFELCCQNKGSVYCIDSSVDASLVASGGTDCMIRLLDPRAGSGRAAKICKLDGHKDNVRCVRIDEGGTRVVRFLLFYYACASLNDTYLSCEVDIFFYGKFSLRAACNTSSILMAYLTSLVLVE